MKSETHNQATGTEKGEKTMSLRDAQKATCGWARVDHYSISRHGSVLDIETTRQRRATLEALREGYELGFAVTSVDESVHAAYWHEA